MKRVESNVFFSNWVRCVCFVFCKVTAFTFEHLFSLEQEQTTSLLQVESCHLTIYWSTRGVPEAQGRIEEFVIPQLCYDSINFSNNPSFIYHHYYGVMHHQTSYMATYPLGLHHKTDQKSQLKNLTLKIKNKLTPKSHTCIYLFYDHQ